MSKEETIELTTDMAVKAYDDQWREKRAAWLAKMQEENKRAAWGEDEQQKNDLKGSSKLGISILIGAAFWLALALLTSGCMVVVHPTEYVDRELADMSDGIHADDRIQLEKLINTK